MLLRDLLSTRSLILASASPRRRELLAGLDIDFRMSVPYRVDEIWPQGLASELVPEYLSGLKSDGYPEPLSPQDILLTADTVVIVGGQILGKPHDEAEARRMLSRLSGGSHKVVTGVTLRGADRRTSFSVTSTVRFRVLDSGEIDYYVKKYRPLDKAGSYGIQEWIGYVGIESIEGSFYNVMGLPVQRLYCELEEFCRQTLKNT